MTPPTRRKARRALVARAFAKINLDLRVLGRRPDGFHEIRTVFQTLALHDTLVVEPVDGPLRLETGSADLAGDRTNLVWRAAEALWDAAGRGGSAGGAAMTLRKRIPLQAGLGGGSSDAAAALVALNAVWDVRLPRADLAAIAAGLGSDVPFFLLGGTALGVGRGEQVYPLPDIGRWSVVLARPSFGVPTADAYGWLAAAGPHPARRGTAALPVPWHPGVLALTNDLETPVGGRFPAIPRLCRQLRSAGAEVSLMAGSGSTVFGLFREAAAARAAAAGLQGSGRVVTVTRALGRREFSALRLAERPRRLPGIHPIG